MKEIIKNAIETYQCPGCVIGGDISCFALNKEGIGCGKHCAGTTIYPIGKVFLGLPKGFNRLGVHKSMKPRVYESYDNNYNECNIAVWKYLTEDNHVLVRGICPRINVPFIDIYLENCMSKINCLEITNEFLEGID